MAGICCLRLIECWHWLNLFTTQSSTELFCFLIGQFFYIYTYTYTYTYIYVHNVCVFVCLCLFVCLFVGWCVFVFVFVCVCACVVNIQDSSIYFSVRSKLR